MVPKQVAERQEQKTGVGEIVPEVDNYHEIKQELFFALKPFQGLIDNLTIAFGPLFGLKLEAVQSFLKRQERGDR